MSRTPSCRHFEPSFSTSSSSRFKCTEDHQKGKAAKASPSVEDLARISGGPPKEEPISSSSSSSQILGYYRSECQLLKPERKPPPNIPYETAVAKSILKEYSTMSGDNLFDHLADIIKRVIDQRPPNVIDFFEEFSRNVREQKFHLPERFPPAAIYEDNQFFRIAHKFLFSMRLPNEDGQLAFAAIEGESYEDKFEDPLALHIESPRKIFLTFNSRVQHLQFFWNQCGFSINTDDIFQLACAMDRLQVHPAIAECRFWGIINGSKASYYIVEAALTPTEIEKRLEQMESEMFEGRGSNQQPALPERKAMDNEIFGNINGREMMPGQSGWENWPAEDLDKMNNYAQVPPVPVVPIIEIFDIPPEPIGLGVNRFSYFVCTSLHDDWIELPIVTPKQLVLSRCIKKFLTGQLEAEIISHPCFPGKEKHYLRTIIARITAGTYIAPANYYRKMTKRETRQFEGEDDEEEEEEEEAEEEEEEMMLEDENIDNDILLLRNEKYVALPVHELAAPGDWLHVRPNILNQGRIVWFDEEKARKEREKELQRLLKLRLAEEMSEEEEEQEEDNEEEGEEEGMLDELDRREYGPAILTPCSMDENTEGTVPWVARYTSKHTNQMERILIMESKTWPGAYTFTFENVCESIYIGSGHKYLSRNMDFHPLPEMAYEYPHGVEDFIEADDPTVADEEELRLLLLERQRKRMRPLAEEGMDEYEDDDVDAQVESGSSAND